MCLVARVGAGHEFQLVEIYLRLVQSSRKSKFIEVAEGEEDQFERNSEQRAIIRPQQIYRSQESNIEFVSFTQGWKHISIISEKRPELDITSAEAIR